MSRFVFGSFGFNLPATEITATRIDDVIPVLEFAERESAAGAWVAVMLSYEAAPAFDPVLAVHEASDFPLAWAGAFTEASEISTPAGTINSNSWVPRVTRDEYDAAVTRIRDLMFSMSQFGRLLLMVRPGRRRLVLVVA